MRLGMLFGLTLLLGSTHAGAMDLESAATGNHRSAANIERNAHRHPVETLRFFEVEPNKTVIELWPGAGWYSEVIAPTLRENGQFIAATFDVTDPNKPGYWDRLMKAYQKKIDAHPNLYDKVVVHPWSPPHQPSLGKADSADVVVSFRNFHGWYGARKADDVLEAVFDVLKPGGVFGIVQHRAKADADPQQSSDQGRLPERTLIELAKAAGFKFAGSSEINANAKDDHSHDVWSLPPTLRNDDKDREKFKAIGESDRMTLKFVKPKK